MIKSVPIKQQYMIVGSDYSAQEPRLTAYYAQDETMLNAYKEGKDLYAVIASYMYDNNYADNLEFYPEGTRIEFNGEWVTCGNKTHKNKEGAARRFSAKSVLIGMLYGRGAASIAEQIGKSKKEAQDIVDKFFNAFPKVKKWIEDTQQSAREKGYVEDFYGRRRRLPDINLPPFTFTINKELNNNKFNPLLICESSYNVEDDPRVIKYKKLLNVQMSSKEIAQIQQQAENEGITIHNNKGFIAQAERQSVNARVQGGAATLTKAAMIAIAHDEVLKELGFDLLLTVHDEVLGECPEVNAGAVGDRLSEIMISTAAKYVNVPMKCDAYAVKCWYEDEYEAAIKTQYKHLVEEDGKSPEEAFNTIVNEHIESLPEDLQKMVYNS